MMNTYEYAKAVNFVSFVHLFTAHFEVDFLNKSLLLISLLALTLSALHPYICLCELCVQMLWPFGHQIIYRRHVGFPIHGQFPTHAKKSPVS